MVRLMPVLAPAACMLAAIGLLERAGLQERARMAIAGFKSATTGRLLWLYFVIRQISAALGLTSLGGHAQMVRPLVAPMAEAAAEARLGPLSDTLRFRIRAHAAAVDNIALFVELCRDAGCLTAPKRFASDHSRFAYFRSAERDADYHAYDDRTVTATVLSGLPGSGKDTWIAAAADPSASSRTCPSWGTPSISAWIPTATPCCPRPVCDS